MHLQREEDKQTVFSVLEWLTRGCFTVSIHPRHVSNMSRILSGEKRDLSQRSQGLNSILELILKINVISESWVFKKKKIPELSFKGDTWSLFSLSSSTSEADTRGWNWVMCNMWLWRGNTERERPLKCQIPPLNFTSIAVNLKCGAGTATRTVRVWRNSERYPDLYTVTRPRGSQKNKLYLQKKKQKTFTLCFPLASTCIKQTPKTSQTHKHGNIQQEVRLFRSS